MYNKSGKGKTFQKVVRVPRLTYLVSSETHCPPKQGLNGTWVADKRMFWPRPDRVDEAGDLVAMGLYSLASNNMGMIMCFAQSMPVLSSD